MYQITSEGYRLRVSKEELVQKEAQEQAKLVHAMADPWNALLNASLNGDKKSEDPVYLYLQNIADDFVEDLISQPGLELARETITFDPDEDRIEKLMEERPLIREISLITPEWIRTVYRGLLRAFRNQIRTYDGSVKKFLNEHDPKLNPAESIFFHLVEHDGSEYPFAFLATYAKKEEDRSIRHVPLHYILKEYAGNQTKILELLSCLNRAADISSLISSLMVSGELFHPLGLEANEAYEFLKKVPELEKTGIVCRIPNWWRKKSRSVSLSIKVGETKSSLLGMDSLLKVRPSLAVDGQKLTKAEIQQILESSESLHFIKGKWIEADPKKLEQLIALMETVPEEMSLKEALRIQDGLSADEGDERFNISNGKWLASLKEKLTRPAILRNVALPAALKAQLRPYQKEGYNWLNSLSAMRFGALLADDMGLGKTLQTLAWLDKEYQKDPEKRALLIVPASLIGNWQNETAHFTPDLGIYVLHGKQSIERYWNIPKNERPFITITTYQTASKLAFLREETWDFLILDEAQAIKNPLAKQTQAVKKIQARMRLAMTGTPIENDLINLWSIFDFLNPGLLGSRKEFQEFAKNEADHTAKLQHMISPFLLRRLKTDRKIIADLPDKLEQTDRIVLSRKQTLLYNEVVDALEKSLSEDKEGIGRQGNILSALMKLKQICNHPDQYTGEHTFSEKDSGKFEMLREVCSAIEENRECVLVFTQFREMTDALDQELEKIFHARGYVIHGGTPLKKRQEIVEKFNAQNTYIPYVVLSLKAAGTGLNLTAASHVIHFDRWWNPAVENQATDRAYRIGQTKNVVVHKFVCTHTIEEKIDQLIMNKQVLADRIITATAASWLTSLSNEELLENMRITG